MAVSLLRHLCVFVLLLTMVRAGPVDMARDANAEGKPSWCGLSRTLSMTGNGTITVRDASVQVPDEKVVSSAVHVFSSSILLLSRLHRWATWHAWVHHVRSSLGYDDGELRVRALVWCGHTCLLLQADRLHFPVASG